MAQQLIITGLADKGNGDPLRTAFTKVNANFTELFNHVSAGVAAGATAPADPGEGDLWWDSTSGRLYVYYDTAWVDASPVDGAGISSTNQLVNGAHTVSLSSVGLTAFPAISNESLFIQASELGSANASIGISAKNNVIVTADILDTAKQWTFGTEGKLTLPAGTTYEYFNTPLAGHGDGLARLDFTLVTDGVETQWAAASANPAGSGYSPGDTFTFDAAFLGIPGASVTIEVLTVGPGGSVENLGFTQPPLYPADIYRDSPINLQVGPESNRWTFGATGDLTVPGAIKHSNNQLDLNYSADGFVNLTSTADNLTSLFLSASQASLSGRLAASISAGESGQGFRDTYIAKTNELSLAFLADNWTGAGYPAGIDSYQQLALAKATNPLIPDAWITIANELKTAWDAWQEVLNFSNLLIAIGGNENVWEFSPDGNITFPDATTTTGKSITLPVDQSLTVNTSYSMGPGGATTFKINPESIKLPSGNGTIFSGTEIAANQWGLDSSNKTLYFPDAGDGVNPQIYYSKVDGVTGMELMTYAKSIKITAAQTNSWTFDASGRLTLPPAGIVKVGVDTAQVGSSLVIATDSGGGLGGWSSTAASIAYDANILSTYAVGSTITFQDGITATLTQVDDYSPSSIDIFWNTPKTGTLFPITLKTANYVAATTSSEWEFGTDGALTLPDASVIASYKPVTVIAATTTAQTITDSASAAFIQFVETVDTAGAYSTGTFTAPYTGYYQVNMSVYFSTTVTLNSGSFLLIDTNLDSNKQVRIIDGGWTGSYLHYSTVISATAGDAIRVAFRQVSGGDIDVSSGSRLTIHRVSIS